MYRDTSCCKGQMSPECFRILTKTIQSLKEGAISIGCNKSVLFTTAGSTTTCPHRECPLSTGYFIYFEPVYNMSLERKIRTFISSIIFPDSNC